MANSPTENVSITGSSHLTVTLSECESDPQMSKDEDGSPDSNLTHSSQPMESETVHHEKRHKNEETSPVAVESTNMDFQSAEKVFQSEDDLTAWENMWRENDNANNPTESQLRKQSLYVQFDPLVQPIEALEKAMKNNNTRRDIAENEESAGRRFVDEDSESTLTGEPKVEQLSSMAYNSNYLHPSSSQLASNMSSETRHEDGEQRSSSVNLISFSPRNDYKKTDGPIPSGAPIYESAAGNNLSNISRSRQEEATAHESIALQEERKSLDAEIRELHQAVMDKRLQVEASKRTSNDLENVVTALRREVERAEVEQRRVQDDILSARRVYHDYHVKASDLLPELLAHKKADQDLRQLLREKQEELKKKNTNYQALKKEAEATKARLASEVSDVRSAAEREVGTLQAKYRKEQMHVSSLMSSLDDKRRENEELTKICDELIAGVEHKS